MQFNAPGGAVQGAFQADGDLAVKRVVDYDDNGYFLDPASTVTSLNVAGAILVDSVEVIGAAGDLRMNNLEPGDFDSTKGYMIFGKSGATTCSNICLNHGLVCSLSYTVAGSSVDCTDTATSARYCWCQ